MSPETTSIIVVLGMHRSGTSAVTRSLPIMGVSLGERMMEAAAEANAKGFYEDIDINSINVELLNILAQDWHTLSMEQHDTLFNAPLTHLQIRAAALLRSRLNNSTCFGFKDPRTCRLLQFWKSVFHRLPVRVYYVIVVRNPVSVAVSLENLHKLPPEKSFYLWLEHLVPAIVLTKDSPRVVVDYDRLMSDPTLQVSRIAKCLGRVSEIDEHQLGEYCQDFLDPSLRHASYTVEDVFSDALVPPPLKRAFKILDGVSADRRSLESARVLSAFDQLSTELQGMSQAFKYLDRLDGIINDLSDRLRRNEQDVASLSQRLTSKSQQLDAAAKEREERGAELSAAMDELAKKDGQLAELEQQLECSRDNAVALTERLAQKDRSISFLMGETATLERATNDLGSRLREHETEISSLEREVAKHRERASWLEQEIRARNAQIQHIGVVSVQEHARLSSLRASLSWKLSAPLRVVQELIPKLTGRVDVTLLPFHQLRAEGELWTCTGDDPQFLLICERKWLEMAGWWLLEVVHRSDQESSAEIYFDLGEGFSSSRAVSLQLSGRGMQTIPLFVPPGCHAIRLDPTNEPGKFQLRVEVLRQLDGSPPAELMNLAQISGYDSLGVPDGNVPLMIPRNDLKHESGERFSWRSVGGDPQFVLKGSERFFHPGWYFIELCIKSEANRGNAKLYFDIGHGFNEADSLILPFSNGRTATGLCYVRRTPKTVRFDPLEQPVAFSVPLLRHTPVNEADAHEQMLQHLYELYADKEHQSLSEFQQELIAKAGVEEITLEQLLYERYKHALRVESGQASISAEYAEWIKENEEPEILALDVNELIGRESGWTPTISVVMPVYNTPESFLVEAIGSVLEQSYPYWELCIADDASTESHVRAVLERYVLQDGRIKVYYRSQNGHISAASNSALGLATGEYVALLDHDDVLAKHALYYVVDALQKNPQAKVLYSDEDKIDHNGERRDPHFKPNWNPDSFFSQNYVSHLGIYRRDLVTQIGGFRPGVEGCQDHDLLLRALAHLTSDEIVHIPRVLYHWRVLEGSSALDPREKEYTASAGIKALKDFFDTRGVQGITVEPGLTPNTYRVRYPVPSPAPTVSLIIPTRDNLRFLEPCVQSILDKTTYPHYEILILDNQSSDPATLDYFSKISAEVSRVKVLTYDHPFNFSAINNFGVEQSESDIVGLINNDIEVISPDWLDEMVSHAIRSEIGCVGAKLYYDDDTIQHAGVIVGLGGVAGHSHKYFPRSSSGYFQRLKIVQNLSAVTAACLVVRKAVYQEVGGFDEQNLTVAFNDVDFCLKVREAGYRNLWTPYAELYHHESKSRGQEDTRGKIQRFQSEIEYMKSKWGDLLAVDPCYNPNLTLAREDFSLG